MLAIRCTNKMPDTLLYIGACHRQYCIHIRSHIVYSLQYMTANSVHT